MSQYPSCLEPRDLDNKPYNGGRTAPPTIPMINKAAPILVKRPNPSRASGQIAGHITALEKPSNAKHTTAVMPWVNMANKTRSILNIVLATSAFLCEIYLGIQMMP